MDNSSYMQVVHSYGKSKQMLMSVVRSTSCSRGWLRLVVQGIFGIIIVCSFIMIVMMTIGSYYKGSSRPNQRCKVISCRVICNDAPYYGEFELDILHATTNTEFNCGRVVLTLNNAMFVNSSLPGQWLSAIRVDITELEIVGGNLQNISPDSFQSQFGGNIRVLVLEKITLATLAADTLNGLSTLQELYIKNCEILNIRYNGLQAVDDTLQILNIRVNDHWNPVNITGSSDFKQLRIVDFAMNEFKDVLGYNSFSEIKFCTVLFLNSCKITYIGAGAFDSLDSIEILHLNNNYLVSLPPELFNKIIPREPRISLQENLWNCSCNNNLRLLFKLGLLIVEPTCFNPIAFRGEKFSSFENYCNDDPISELIDGNLYVVGAKAVSTVNHQCVVNSSEGNYTLRLHSPLPEFKCLSNNIRQWKPQNIGVFSTDNNWLKPSFSIEGNGFSMVGLEFSGPLNYGLIWYYSTCPKVIYCINHLPKLLRIYNDNPTIEYTFCRFFVTPTGIGMDQCIAYDMASLQQTNIVFYKSILLTVCIAIICLLSGALCVFALIHKKPILLKGNKRVVFVKHKTVDALILPTKKHVRKNFTKDLNKDKSPIIFTIPRNRRYSSEIFSRTNSVRTNGSNDPSYISALQPTEDQLAEWRITRNFETKCIYDSVDSYLSTHSQVISIDSFPYYSYDSTEQAYDTNSIKL